MPVLEPRVQCDLVDEIAARPTELVAERIRSAFAGRDLASIGPLFAPEARWGNCVGGDQIVQWMQRAMAEGVAVTLVDVDARTDRVVLTLDLQRTGGDDASLPAPTAHYQAAFVVDGKITELRDAADRDAALRATPNAPPPSPLGPRTTVTTAAATLPVRELTAALERYRRLGFTVHAYKGGGYGFAERGTVELHLGEVPDLDPSANLCAVYLFADDADALYAEWRAADVSGRLFEPSDTEYGMREGSYVDPDGNRMRFGSPIHD